MHVACVNKNALQTTGRLKAFFLLGWSWGAMRKYFACVTSFKFVAWDFDGSLAHMFPPYLLPNDFLISEVMVQVPSKLVVSKRASKNY